MRFLNIFFLLLLNINLYSATALLDDDPNNFCGYKYQAYYIDETTFSTVFSPNVGNHTNYGLSYTRTTEGALDCSYLNQEIQEHQNVVYNADGTYKEYSIYYAVQHCKEYGGNYHNVQGTSKNYTCELKPEFPCPDGGLSLNGTCDRTCEEVGMHTLQNFLIDQANPADNKKCVANVTDNDVLALCIDYCTNGGYYEGMIDDYYNQYGTNMFSELNINTFISNIDTINGGFTASPECICETDPTSGDNTGGDNTGGDNTGSSADMTETNNKLEDLKTKQDTTNNKLEDIQEKTNTTNMKLDDTNQKLDTSNDWLSKIDTVLRDIFSSNENINDNIDNTNTKLDILHSDNASQDNWLSQINTKISDIFNDLLGFRNDVNNKLDENNQKLQNINDSVDNLHTTVGSLSTNGQRINENLEGVKNSVDSVEVAVSSANGTLSDTGFKINDVNNNLDNIELQNDSTNQKLDDVNNNLNTIEGQNDSTNQKLDEINNKLDENNQKLGDVDGSINDLNDSLDIDLSEVNQHLTNIEETNQNISDKINELQDLTPDTIKDDIGENLHILDDILDEYSTFKDNLTDQYESVVELGESAKETLNGGFTSIFSSHSSSITECSQSFSIDFTSIGFKSVSFDFDPCYATSMLRPILYPIFYIIFSIYVFSFALDFFRGVL